MRLETIFPCTTCGGSTSVVESKYRGKGLYRRRRCDAPECSTVVVSRELVMIGVPGDAKLASREVSRGVGRSRVRRTPEETAAMIKATAKRMNIRKAARKEAESTGEDVELVYERWGAASRYMRRSK